MNKIRNIVRTNARITLSADDDHIQLIGTVSPRNDIMSKLEVNTPIHTSEQHTDHAYTNCLKHVKNENHWLIKQ